MSATPIILPAPGAQDEKTEGDAASEKDEAPLVEAETVVDPDAPIVLSEAILAASPFTDLSDKIISAIEEASSLREYAAGQTVFSMGQYDGADAFVVARGKMRVSVIDAETGSVIVDDIGEGRSFAVDLTFVEGEKSVYSRLAVTAEEDLALVFIDAEALRTLAGQRPSLMRNLAQFFAEELGERRFNAMAAEAAPQQRVFAELLKFIERDGVTGLWRVQRMPKHRELADLADVDESIAAGAVATLIQEGIARRDYPGLIVEDMTRLNELAG